MELNTRTSKKMTLLWAAAYSYERLNNKLNLLALIITGKEQEGHKGKRWGLSSIRDKDDTS
ncbi:hypothetical protein MUK42_19121 [Musa troglodytarum]|uniref:Uncharacterized protein n=1 Tax=Musa troglodytarum TaxID=320322 RepID=A0A9E7JL70_9LILI|nr:hypothetical protein MUK42_19121 [Musa troglodytarum]